MALDPKGAHGAPMPPKDAPLCTFCQDSGFHQIEGPWKFCGCPSGTLARTADEKQVDEMNYVLRRLEERTKRK
jgi:hypothetical protein